MPAAVSPDSPEMRCAASILEAIKKYSLDNTKNNAEKFEQELSDILSLVYRSNDTKSRKAIQRKLSFIFHPDQQVNWKKGSHLSDDLKPLAAALTDFIHAHPELLGQIQRKVNDILTDGPRSQSPGRTPTHTAQGSEPIIPEVRKPSKDTSKEVVDLMYDYLVRYVTVTAFLSVSVNLLFRLFLKDKEDKAMREEINELLVEARETVRQNLANFSALWRLRFFFEDNYNHSYPKPVKFFSGFFRGITTLPLNIGRSILTGVLKIVLSLLNFFLLKRLHRGMFSVLNRISQGQLNLTFDKEINNYILRFRQTADLAYGLLGLTPKEIEEMGTFLEIQMQNLHSKDPMLLSLKQHFSILKKGSNFQEMGFWAKVGRGMLMALILPFFVLNLLIAQSIHHVVNYTSLGLAKVAQVIDIACLLLVNIPLLAVQGCSYLIRQISPKVRLRDLYQKTDDDTYVLLNPKYKASYLKMVEDSGIALRPIQEKVEVIKQKGQDGPLQKCTLSGNVLFFQKRHSFTKFNTPLKHNEFKVWEQYQENTKNEDEPKTPLFL